MDFFTQYQGIWIAGLVLGGLGVAFGAMLGYADKKFSASDDQKTIAIAGALPGANCGGCGYSGCAAFAKAVAEGSATPDKCPVGGHKTAKQIAAIMGGEEHFEHKTARVLCAGDSVASPNKFEYTGLKDCGALSKLSGGTKQCSWGCLGFGDCVKVCKYGAIAIHNGIARVDRKKCTACGMCVKACPRKLIEIIPVAKPIFVACSSKDKNTKDFCKVGCIACRICEKVCQYDAIKLEDNLAKIDYKKCTVCGRCEDKCPRKIIKGI